MTLFTTSGGRWPEGGAEIAVRHYVNLGIEDSTPRGLLVPSIGDAQDSRIKDLAGALNRLTLVAREGKTPVPDQQRGTITIINIGVFRLDAGTPMINSGASSTVAIAMRR